MAGGSTGTSAGGVGSSNGSLAGNQNSLLTVTAGQTYAMLVSNFTGGGTGYDLNFNAPGNTASIFDVTPPAYGAITAAPACGGNTVTFTLSEPIQCSSLTGGEYNVTGPSGFVSTATAVGSGCPGTTNTITLTLATAPTVAGSYNINTTAPSAANGFDVVLDACGNEQVASSLPFTIACVLPVELVSFIGETKENTHNLKWVTATEIETAFFDVERSANNGIDYESVGIVSATGNSNTLKSYSFIDETPLRGITYYRLKIVDKNADFKYSSILPLNYLPQLDFQIINFINQKDKLSIEFISDVLANGNIKIYDLLGKEVVAESKNFQPGNNNLDLNITTLNKGLYLLVLSNGNKILSQKFFVE